MLLKGASIAAFAAMILIPFSLASPVPMVLEGRLMLDGTDAPNGTSILALGENEAIAGVLKSRQAGYYSLLYIYGDNPETARAEGAKAGERISFLVGGYKSIESINWKEGSFQKLDLSAFTAPSEFISGCEKQGEEVQIVTDKWAYKPGEKIKVSGFVTYDCKPRSTDEIAYKSGISGSRNVESNNNGYFTLMETVPDKPEKSYSISASYGNSSQQVVVQISACMDADKDGFFELNVELKCSPADCDDRNFFVNPAAKEICDDIDNNCNGLIDENISCPDFVQPDETENSGTGDRNITSLMIAKGVSIESIGFVRLIYIGLLICLAIFAIASYFVVKRL